MIAHGRVVSAMLGIRQLQKNPPATPASRTTEAFQKLPLYDEAPPSVLQVPLVPEVDG